MAFYFITFTTAAWGYALLAWLAEILRQEPEARAFLVGVAVTLVCKWLSSEFPGIRLTTRYRARHHTFTSLEGRGLAHIPDWIPSSRRVRRWRYLSPLCDPSIRKAKQRDLGLRLV